MIRGPIDWQSVWLVIGLMAACAGVLALVGWDMRRVLRADAARDAAERACWTAEQLVYDTEFDRIIHTNYDQENRS